MSNWDSDIMDDLDDDLEDTEDDLDDDMSLEDGGDEVSGDDEQLSEEELSADYAVSDQGVRALSADRGAAMHQAKILGEVGGELEKKLSGGSAIKVIVVHFANGRKLYLTP
jgi:hypothetical protein